MKLHEIREKRMGAFIRRAKVFVAILIEMK